MHNKLIISAFALFLTLAAFGQSEPVEDVVVSAEYNFANQKLDPNNRIEIYPNPAVDYIIVEIKNSTLENTEFELHSIIGNEIKIEVEETRPGRYKIPVENFATGYYFLVVKDEVARFKKAFKFLKN